ncbi:MAG: hypothetical protein IPK22_11160 [Verrucomicrobiaceae bacterium]|nr:hypothetical protein [Verrucomicrobiaceae bacterium]
MITTLSTDILAKVRAAVLDAGETDSNDYLHEQLHETAQDRAEEILREHCPDIEHLDKIENDQRTELIQSYKDGFWEPTHLSERDALKAALECAYRHTAAMQMDGYTIAERKDLAASVWTQLRETFHKIGHTITP